MVATTSCTPASEEGQRRILAAARSAFASHGFEGASLRGISEQAGVLHTAMLYHFKRKDALWRAVMQDLFAQLEQRLQDCRARHADDGERELARQLLREFVHFCAAYPELHRIMTHEGRCQSARLEWLVAHHTGPLFAAVSALLPLTRPGLFANAAQLYYAIVGLAASPFTLAPEYQRLSGYDPFDPGQQEATAVLLERLILGESTTG